MGSYYYKGYKINGEYSKVYWSKKGKEQYCKQFVCLDTETSHNHNDDLPECWVYQWAFTNVSIMAASPPILLKSSMI